MESVRLQYQQVYADMHVSLVCLWFLALFLDLFVCLELIYCSTYFQEPQPQTKSQKLANFMGRMKDNEAVNKVLAEYDAVKAAHKAAEKAAPQKKPASAEPEKKPAGAEPAKKPAGAELVDVAGDTNGSSRKDRGKHRFFQNAAESGLQGEAMDAIKSYIGAEKSQALIIVTDWGLVDCYLICLHLCFCGESLSICI